MLRRLRRRPPPSPSSPVADASSPWAVTAVAPAAAPGPRPPRAGACYTQYFTAPGAPARRPRLPPAAGRCGPRSTTRSTQTWGPPTTVLRRRREPVPVGRQLDRRARSRSSPSAVRCGGATSSSPPATALAWQALRMGRARARASPPTAATSPCPAAASTYVISPSGASSPCPVGVHRAVRRRRARRPGRRRAADVARTAPRLADASCSTPRRRAGPARRGRRSRRSTPGRCTSARAVATTGPTASTCAARARPGLHRRRSCGAAASGRCGAAAGDLTPDARTPPAGAGRGRSSYVRAGQPLRSLTFSVAAGSTECRSPTTPKSTSSKIGASGSLLTATIVFEVCMPARCWIAPEMPLAT